MCIFSLKQALLEVSIEHNAVDGVRVWLPHASSWARAIRREYATTLGELLMHRHGLVETY